MAAAWSCFHPPPHGFNLDVLTCLLNVGLYFVEH